MKSGTMLESGINSVAAALVLRHMARMGIEAEVRIEGEGMNHNIKINLPDGRHWNITSAREWFELAQILRRGTNEI